MKNNLIDKLVDWIEYRVEHKHADVRLSESTKIDLVDQEIDNLITVLDELMNRHDHKKEIERSNNLRDLSTEQTLC